jgi:hypothetical protein
MATAADALAPLPNRIEPRWWTGTAPIASELFTIDRAGQPITAADLEPGSELARDMNRMFDETGIVLVTNTGLTDLATMRRIARHVITAEMDYTGGANPRDSLEENIYEVGALAAVSPRDGLHFPQYPGARVPRPQGHARQGRDVRV